MAAVAAVAVAVPTPVCSLVLSSEGGVPGVRPTATLFLRLGCVSVRPLWLHRFCLHRHGQGSGACTPSASPFRLEVGFSGLTGVRGSRGPFHGVGARPGPPAGTGSSVDERPTSVCASVRGGDTQSCCTRAGARGAGEAGALAPPCTPESLVGGQGLRPMPAAPPELPAAHPHDFKVIAILLTALTWASA